MMSLLRKLLFNIFRDTRFLYSEETYLRLIYYSKLGVFPHLDPPVTFNEKILWLKLHDRKEIYHRMVDKSTAKDYVDSIVGPGHTLRTLGVWDSPSDIDWDVLPRQFVLKLTAGAGGRSVCVCRDKDTFDREAAVRRLETDARRGLYRIYGEWAYKDVPQRVIAEELLPGDDPSAMPSDYKFWCFNGKARIVMVGSGRYRDGAVPSFHFLDTDWNPLPFWKKYPPTGETPPKPAQLAEMIDMAEKLSRGMDFLRVDLYNEGGKVWFGELTFYPSSGTGPFHPEEWDTITGKMLSLTCAPAPGTASASPRD